MDGYLQVLLFQKLFQFLPMGGAGHLFQRFALLGLAAGRCEGYFSMGADGDLAALTNVQLGNDLGQGLLADQTVS